MSDKPAYIHHVNFPTTDPERTIEWYSKVEDWEGFLAHLDSLGIRHTRVITRPENNSQFCYIHDPDHTMIELVFHERRPYPPVPKKEPAEASADQGVGDGAESADEARADLAAAERR